MGIWKWLLSLVLAMVMGSAALGAPVHLDLVPDGGVAHVYASAAEDTPDVCGIQAMLTWEPACMIHEQTFLPASACGFFGAGPNTVLDDGDAGYVWLCPASPVTPITVGATPTHVADIWFDLPHGVTVDLTLESLGGIPTKVVLVGGQNVWDGECESVVLPEPATLALLGLGLLLASRRGARLG